MIMAPKPQRPNRQDLGLTPGEYRTLARLDTPRKIQTFLDAIPQNFEIGGQTCLSVREVLKQRRAMCIEGAMLAACALWINGEPPLLFDLKAKGDYDHVVAIYRRGGCWGALSKTNSVPLRGRDPVYRNLRELAMSYFHEYANRRNQKTLRSYSLPYDLRRMKPEEWITNGKHCWDVGWALEAARHYPLLHKRQLGLLTLRNRIERDSMLLKLHRRPHARKAAR
jgi:hypothetical protein